MPPRQMPSARTRFTLALAAAALGAAAPASAQKPPFEVAVDQSILVKLAAPAESVVIGNGAVIDVSVHDATTLLVTGKSWGATNLMVLDHGGRTIYSNMIAVVDETPGGLTIVRGEGTYSYSCFDKCRPVAQAGDAPEHVAAVVGTAKSKSSAAEGR